MAFSPPLFQQAAKDFASDKQRRKLLLDQKISAHQTDADHIASMGRAYFDFALSVLKKSLESYSAKTGMQVKIDLPPIQDRLFIDPDVRYAGEVVFSQNQRWQFLTLTTHGSPDIAPPMIVIRLVNAGREKGEFMLQFGRNMKDFFVRFQQDFQLAVSKESFSEPITSYEKTIKSVLLKLVEFQLLRD